VRFEDTFAASTIQFLVLRNSVSTMTTTTTPPLNPYLNLPNDVAEKPVGGNSYLIFLKTFIVRHDILPAQASIGRYAAAT
jgi:hypothetical protein